MNTTYTEITSLFDYLESKQSDIREMMEAEPDAIIEPKHQGRDPRKETAEDWEKIQSGMTVTAAAIERGISYSQIRKRLKQFGYK